MTKSKFPVGIVGAGICGLTLARKLNEAGVPTLIFEKSRGYGGRFATRRTEGGLVDHGISWIELNQPDTVEPATEWVERGLLVRSPLDPKRWVCPLGMTHLAKTLAEGLTVERDHKVTRLSIAPGAANWHVKTEGQAATAQVSALVLTAPVPQAIELFQASFPNQLARVVDALSPIQYRPTIVLIGNLEDGIPKKLTTKAPFELAVASEAKGVPSATGAVALFFDERFSRLWFEKDEKQILEEAIRVFHKTYALKLEAPQIKKWRYARAVTPTKEPFYLAPTQPPLYFAGDGFAGGELLGAHTSALAVATHFLAPAKAAVGR